MEFCDKLAYIMTELHIKSAALARNIPVDPALVSRWRTGQRVPKDEDTVNIIAEFITKSAKAEKEKAFLCYLLSDYEGEDLTIAEKAARWLFDGKDTWTAPYIQQPQPAGVCFPGADGFLTAVSMLEYAVRQRVSRPEITVYVSTEHMNLLLDERVSVLWARLHALNGGPVPVILEQSLDAERLSMLLSVLLPYMQAGRLLLHYVPSAQRQFCYHLTILAKGVGMVMAMEPPGVQDVSVSMFIDQLPFVSGVGNKLAELHISAKPLLRLLRNPADERGLLKQCFQGDRPVCARFGTVNLLYAGPDAYKELLRANGVPYESRRWRVSEFSAMRNAFENFLAFGHYKEIIPLTAIERLVKETAVTVPDLRFIETKHVLFPVSFVKGLVRGMVSFLRRFPTLEITLARSGGDSGVTRIKEDSLLFLQNISNSQPIALSSENWLVINQYTRDFHEQWHAGNDIFGKNNVLYTLNALLKKLEESE